MEQKLGKEAWQWAALLGGSYALTMLGVFGLMLLSEPWRLLETGMPLWLFLTLMMAGAVLAGLVIALPTWFVMKRLQLWVLPRLALGLDVGKPTIPLRVKDMYRFGWGMSTGDGRFVMEHLELVRTGSVLGDVAEGVPLMDQERLAAIRKEARKGQWWKTTLGAVAGLFVGLSFIVVSETGMFEAYWITPAVLVIFLPVAIVLGLWPRIKQWARAYSDWVQSSQA